MSNIRLFFSRTLSKNLIDKLDKSQSHYLTKVMRLKKNDTFSLFNKTGEWEAKILNITKDLVEFKSVKIKFIELEFKKLFKFCDCSMAGTLIRFDCSHASITIFSNRSLLIFLTIVRSKIIGKSFETPNSVAF